MQVEFKETPEEIKKEWVGLTDEEIRSLFDEMSLIDIEKDVRLIEAKLKEKNA